MTDIIYPVVVLGGLGSAFGVILAIASKVFFVPTDPRVEELQNVLPGANCGACGYPGCAGLASALAEGKAPVNACSIGGQKVADMVADILGAASETVEKQVAVVLCQGDCDKAKDKYIYEGIQDCRIADTLADGQKSCSFGCLGCGTCYNVCQFDAIEMINGVAVIDREKCTACKKCVEVCPKHIIEMVPYDNHAIVKCKSEDTGKVVRSHCTIGCIGCKICVKNCPEDAFTFENNLAKIIYDKCTNCMTCVEKCPTKCIVNPVEEESLVN
ncbi:RnfABCDGE type electron transport complex subunit B [Tissierella sp. Yu-01]|uniref:RnfABCDGE type electron transport complex subunit B n=1 Tax=Tissierella sp. Yu-01 TaxID=3035694 RepID=UPI00240D89DB|nr:RnfABCDGE type electron transport complex subunit B [Tissierella sp. Yu-01]WFA09483.1 RnfABCDGE type electron transport complex subunit B [Tissierella sp. Yu-01]